MSKLQKDETVIEKFMTALQKDKSNPTLFVEYLTLMQSRQASTS